MDGTTPLHAAAKNGHLAVVRYLVEVENGANVKARATDAGTPQEIAERAGHREIVTYFENHERKLAFTQALERDDVERLKQIVEAGHVRVNTPIYGRCTSLYLAAQKGCREIVKIFVENGEEDTLKNVIDQRDYNLSPLYIAVQNGYFEIVKLLIYGKAESNHSRAENREEVLEGEAVRDREAAVENLINQEGGTLLHVAAARGYEHIVRLLVEFMAIAAEKYEDSQDKPLYQGHMMRELAYVSRVDNYGTTAESLARDVGFTAIANFLKEVKKISKRDEKI
ncbi:MAG: ankyrin repeat domain-containing protein [Cytophagales bacterium]|nr:ankyrin repeat domain-containing protein [Cytophagales bacterium]